MNLFGLDLLKQILAICVITQHIKSITRYSIEVNQQLGMISGAVLGFFLISGFFLKVPNQGNWLQSISLFARKQTIRLLVPFFVFSFSYAILMALLGKNAIADGIVSTLTLHGSSMQLYFLPYLFYITVAYALLQEGFRSASASQLLVIHISTALVLLLICLAAPTTSVAGSDPQLIKLYALAFIVGRIFSICYDHFQRPWVTGLVVGGCAAASGFLDARLFYLLVIVLLFTAAITWSKYLPQWRLRGSGGVYLMHTPLNFTVSTVLFHLGVLGLLNAGISILITYLLCLGTTLIVIKHRPHLKWILLE